MIGSTNSILFDGTTMINIANWGALAKIWVKDPITILVFAKATAAWNTVANWDLWSFSGLNTSQAYINYHDGTALKLCYRHYANGTNIDNYIDDIPTGWFSSAFVVSANTLKPYYNGSPRATSAASAWLAGNLTFGALSNALNPTPTHGWVGNLAHFSIWFRDYPLHNWRHLPHKRYCEETMNDDDYLCS